MKTLGKNEWVAVVVAVFVVGFFFVFGQSLVSLITKTNTQNMPQTPQLQVQDTVVGMGEEAVVGSRVVVNYVGHFPDGKVFDSSIARNEQFQFVLGSGQV